MSRKIVQKIEHLRGCIRKNPPIQGMSSFLKSTIEEKRMRHPKKEDDRKSFGYFRSQPVPWVGLIILKG